MKKGLEDYLADFGEAANRASEIGRNLGLGAIAAIWIFKNPEGAHKLLPGILVWALLLAVLGLGADLMHYVFKAIALYVFFKRKEWLYDHNKLSEAAAADLHAPPYIERGTWILFGMKLVAVIAAYVLILVFLFSRL